MNPPGSATLTSRSNGRGTLDESAAARDRRRALEELDRELRRYGDLLVEWSRDDVTTYRAARRWHVVVILALVVKGDDRELGVCFVGREEYRARVPPANVDRRAHGDEQTPVNNPNIHRAVPAR